MMTLEFREIEQPEGSAAREWAVFGTEGAINFLVFPKEKVKEGSATAAVIGIHARRKLATLPRKGKCDLLHEGRCYEESRFQGASELWNKSGKGRNTGLIQDILERWYTETFGKKE
jgi:hypothetical protein